MIDDSSLIKLAPEKGSLKFILGIAFVFSALTVIWGWGSEKYIENTVPLSFTTTESNLAKIIQVVSHPDVQVALVGTSVMDRLETPFFSIPGVANLALEGGSSVTGLEIILRKQIRPEVVYVETNFVSNFPNASVLSETKGDRLSSILSGSIKPLRYLFSSKTSHASWNEWERNRQTLLQQAPIDYNNTAEIQKGVDWYNSKEGKSARADPAPMIERINKIAGQLESQGVRVFYVHIPLAPPYEETSFFKGYRLAVTGNGGYECPRCVDLSKYLDVSQLRWGDGIHLDDRSAILVAKALESHIMSLRAKIPTH
jgi:hypothetical protein